jgi:hypothetical protein
MGLRPDSFKVNKKGRVSPPCPDSSRLFPILPESSLLELSQAMFGRYDVGLFAVGC